LPVKVLLVEDNPVARVSLEKLLKLSGFDVQSAETLREGHEKLDGQAVLILDLNLPDGNGVDLLNRIRTENRAMRVIIASACGDPKVMNDVRTLQPDAVLCKPLDFKGLLELLGPA
jgi:DNA-binding response OmpR family regulator